MESESNRAVAVRGERVTSAPPGLCGHFASLSLANGLHCLAYWQCLTRAVFGSASAVKSSFYHCDLWPIKRKQNQKLLSPSTISSRSRMSHIGRQQTIETLTVLGDSSFWFRFRSLIQFLPLWSMDDKAETEPNTINVMVWVNRKLTGPIQWRIQGGHPPTAQNFLNFMQFFGKFDKIICWRPLLEFWRPSYGESWIRPCNLWTADQ